MKNYKYILFYAMCILTVGAVVLREETSIVDTKYVYASKEIIDKYEVVEEEVGVDSNSNEEVSSDNGIVDDDIDIDADTDSVGNDTDADTVWSETITEPVLNEAIEVQYGKLSRYGPDCYGCSGYVAYGKYVGDGTIYYYDNYYGNVRILAGDRSYPFGTIVRVSFEDESFLGIVLDRGGAIGFNRTALFDLLYPSEYLANIDGVNYNTKFEVLRIGF